MSFLRLLRKQARLLCITEFIHTLLDSLMANKSNIACIINIIRDGESFAKNF